MSGTRLERDWPTRQTSWPREFAADSVEDVLIDDREEDFVQFVVEVVAKRSKAKRRRGCIQAASHKSRRTRLTAKGNADSWIDAHRLVLGCRALLPVGFAQTATISAASMLTLAAGPSIAARRCTNRAMRALGGLDPAQLVKLEAFQEVRLIGKPGCRGRQIARNSVFTPARRCCLVRADAVGSGGSGPILSRASSRLFARRRGDRSARSRGTRLSGRA